MSDQKVTTEEMIALVHGRLSSEEASRVQELVHADIDLRHEFEELKAVGRSLDELMLLQVDPMPSVADEVMEEVAVVPPSRISYRLATFMTVCVALPVGFFLWNVIGPTEVVRAPSYGGSGGGIGGGMGGGRHGTTYNDVKIANATHAIMAYLEGSFSALGMLVCGSVGILSLVIGAAGKSRRASLVGLTFLVFAMAFFLLRAGISYFFNDVGISQ